MTMNKLETTKPKPINVIKLGLNIYYIQEKVVSFCSNDRTVVIDDDEASRWDLVCQGQGCHT